MRHHLLLIPGLGDRVWLYRLVVPLWRVFGYDVHVHSFGWNSGVAEFAEKQAQLVRAADQFLPERLYVIGASAGGVAAINLLAARPGIRKVITLATPLRATEIPTKELLIVAFKQSDDFLDRSEDSMKRKIVSVHGMYDNRVPVALSVRPGIRSVQLPTLGHGSTILLALTLFSNAVRQFLIYRRTT